MTIDMSRHALPFSQDAAIVLALAGTALPFAATPEDEAERWLRSLRLHGRVGAVLQALGVGERPLETAAQPRWVTRRQPRGRDMVEAVTLRAIELAGARGAELVGTADVLFAVIDTYGRAFDRALYIRGTSREELLARLAASGTLAAG